jgi:hypothetical protein
MGLPRVRFTVRRLMLSVSVVAILAAGVEVMRRQAVARARATKHAAMQVECERASRLAEERAKSMELLMERGEVEAPTSFPLIDPTAGATTLSEARALAIRYAKEAAYHAQLRRKYERAAACPLLAVEPDQPPR